MKEIEYKEFIGYVDYKKLIYHLAGKWCVYLGVSFDEAVGEANLAYARALKTYEHGRVKFSNYLTNKIIGYYKNMYNRNKEIYKISYDVELSKNYRNDVDVLKDNLSFDGLFLVDLILDPPEGLRKNLNNKKDRHRKRKIKKYIKKNYKWTELKIERVFEEIKNNL